MSLRQAWHRSDPDHPIRWGNVVLALIIFAGSVYLITTDALAAAYAFLNEHLLVVAPGLLVIVVFLARVKDLLKGVSILLITCAGIGLIVIPNWDLIDRKLNEYSNLLPRLAEETADRLVPLRDDRARYCAPTQPGCRLDHTLPPRSQETPGVPAIPTYAARANPSVAAHPESLCNYVAGTPNVSPTDPHPEDIFARCGYHLYADITLKPGVWTEFQLPIGMACKDCLFFVSFNTVARVLDCSRTARTVAYPGDGQEWVNTSCGVLRATTTQRPGTLQVYTRRH
jgi:hypothetical protein